jgi:NAD(P)H dehydrogenase (quinone)
MPVQAAQGLLGVQQLIGSGDLEVTSDDFATVLGKPLTPLVQGLKEVLGLTSKRS